MSYNVTATSHFTSKRDGVDAYHDFLLKIKQKRGDFPFEYKDEEAPGKRPFRMAVASWGSYITGDNEWRVFICWRGGRFKTTRITSWSWSVEDQCCVDLKINGFVGD